MVCLQSQNLPPEPRKLLTNLNAEHWTAQMNGSENRFWQASEVEKKNDMKSVQEEIHNFEW